MTANNPELSRFDRILEASVEHIPERGSFHKMGTVLGGSLIGLAAMQVNEAMQDETTMTCSIEVPTSTKSLTVEDVREYMDCDGDTQNEMTVFVGAAVLGGVAIYQGWKQLVKSRLGSEGYEKARRRIAGTKEEN